MGPAPLVYRNKYNQTIDQHDTNGTLANYAKPRYNSLDKIIHIRRSIAKIIIIQSDVSGHLFNN